MSAGGRMTKWSAARAAIRGLTGVALLIVCPMLAATQLRLVPVQPITSNCEVRSIGFDLADGSRSEVAFDPPFEVLSEPSIRELHIPDDARNVSVDARGCWAEAALSSTGHPVQLEVRVWPIAYVEARLEGARQLPREVTGVLVDIDSDGHGTPRELVCSMVKDLVRCEMPGLRPVHLRLSASGYLPLFALDVSGAEGETRDLGSHVLMPGSRVEGGVTGPDGGPLEGAEVQLVPITAGELHSAERVLRDRRTTSDEKGTYRFDDVERGVYRIESSISGRSDVVLPRFEVTAPVNRVPPLQHSARAHIDVSLSPPVSSGGSPWRVSLRAKGLRASEVVVVEAGETSPAGHWQSRALNRGMYTVVVSDGDGSEVAREEVMLDGRDEWVSMVVSGVHVEGRLLAGDEGRAGNLEFRDDLGAARNAEADEDGRFAVAFPHAGTWRPRVQSPPESANWIGLSPIEIAEGSSERIELRLPGGRVEGRVVQESGKSVEGAIVSVRVDGNVVSQTRSGEDGRFELTNLDEATCTVEAEAKSGFAPRIEVDLADTNPAEVELTLEPWRAVRGSVREETGRALSGAVVRVISLLTGKYDDTIADAEGMFEVPLRGDGAVDVIVMAPPRPVIVRRIPPEHWHERPVVMIVPSAGGVLRLGLVRVPPWPVIAAGDGVIRSVGLFTMPRFAGVLSEFVDGFFQFVLEPGAYRVCFGEECHAVSVAPGSVETLDFFEVPETEVP